MIIRGAVLREMGLPQPYAESRPLRTEQVELAPPGPGELLVRVRAAGLCHSDLSVIDGSRPRVMPMLLGHEATGEVVRSEAPGFAPGDTVGFAFVPACGGCGPCAEGRAALCEPGAAANTAGTLLGGAQRLDGVHHHLGVSGFADHAVVSARSAVKIDPSLPPEIAALFGCAVMTGVGAVVNTARIQPGQSAVVFGLGGVGLAALLGAVLAGAHPIVAVDVVPEKLALATSLGATTAIDARPTESSAAPTAAPSEVSPNAAIPSGAGPSSGALNAAIPSGAGPSDDARTVTSQSEPASSAAAPRTAAPTAAAFDVVEAVREATAGGADYAFETVGSAAVLGQAYAATRRGGTTVTVGLPHPYQLLSIPAVSLVAEERTLKGSYLGSAVPSRDIPRYIALYRAGRLPVDRLLTSTVSLDGLNEAFDELAAGTSIRQVLVF